MLDMNLCESFEESNIWFTNKLASYCISLHTWILLWDVSTVLYFMQYNTDTNWIETKFLIHKSQPTSCLHEWATMIMFIASSFENIHRVLRYWRPSDWCWSDMHLILWPQTSDCYLIDINLRVFAIWIIMDLIIMDTFNHKQLECMDAYTALWMLMLWC